MNAPKMANIYFPWPGISNRILVYFLDMYFFPKSILRKYTFRRKARVRKCKPFWPFWWHGPRRSLRRPWNLGIRERQLVLLSCSLFVNNNLKTVLQSFMSFTLISHTSAHAVRGRRTPNHVERFRNGSSIHEFYISISSQMCKIYTSFV